MLKKLSLLSIALLGMSSAFANFQCPDPSQLQNLEFTNSEYWWGSGFVLSGTGSDDLKNLMGVDPNSNTYVAFEMNPVTSVNDPFSGAKDYLQHLGSPYVYAWGDGIFCEYPVIDHPAAYLSLQADTFS